jgi:hypothetical protein
MNTQINESTIAYLTSHPWLILIIIWSFIWKGLALWKASKNNHLTIFIILLVLNTIGIGEIVYLAYLYVKAKKKVTTN